MMLRDFGTKNQSKKSSISPADFRIFIRAIQTEFKFFTIRQNVRAA